MIRKRTLFSNNKGVDPKEANACDIVLASKADDSLIIVRNGEWSASAYPASSWEPVGVVVIPGSHGYIKDGSGTVNQCGIISIFEMDTKNPETGASWGASMYWGGYGEAYSGKSDGLGRYDSYQGNGLFVRSNLVITANNTSNTASGLSSSDTGHLPIQVTVGGTPTRNSSPYVPSPYIGNDYKSGGYNASYGTTSFDTSSKKNALADNRGVVNTKIITDMATRQSDWRTAATITNEYRYTNYPAACCCARYHTRGTKAFVDCTTNELYNGVGFWYLPAIGELGYLAPKFYDINNTISKLNTAYKITDSTMSTSEDLWSSSLTSSYNRYILTMSYGYTQSKTTAIAYSVRAFMRL